MRLVPVLAVSALFGLSLLDTSPAFAHELELKNWCAAPSVDGTSSSSAKTSLSTLTSGGIGTTGSTPLVTKSFYLTGPELDKWIADTIDAVRRINNGERLDVCTTDKCGIVDFRLLINSGLKADDLANSDPWTKANIAMAHYCYQHQVPGYDVSVAYVKTFSYLAQNHHTAFRTANGLSGSCLSCPLDNK